MGKRHKVKDKREEEGKIKFSNIKIGDYYEDADTLIYLKISERNVFDIKNETQDIVEEENLDKKVIPLETVLEIKSTK